MDRNIYKIFLEMTLVAWLWNIKCCWNIVKGLGAWQMAAKYSLVFPLVRPKEPWVFQEWAEEENGNEEQHRGYKSGKYPVLFLLFKKGDSTSSANVQRLTSWKATLMKFCI